MAILEQRMIALIGKGIVELDARLDEKTNRIAALEAENDSLKIQLADCQNMENSWHRAAKELMGTVAELNTQLADRCEHCGATVSHYSNGCPTCGAPECCPMCCKVEYLKAQLSELQALLPDNLYDSSK